MVKIATDATFSELISGGQPVVVDFWATWCGPCKALSPIVDEVAEQYNGKAVVVKCNVDDCEDTALKYGIRNIPTLLFFKDGNVVERTVGVVTKERIAGIIDSLQ